MTQLRLYKDYRVIFIVFSEFLCGFTSAADRIPQTYLSSRGSGQNYDILAKQKTLIVAFMKPQAYDYIIGL